MSQSDSGTTKPSQATSLTTETSLSLLYKALRTVIRPLRPHLVKPDKPLPAGSPQLTKRPNTKNGVSIVESKQGDLWIYTFAPSVKPKSTTPKHRVLYFAGGGFQSPPSSEHWSFVSKLAYDLQDDYLFTLVSYPLGPNSPASASLPLLQTHLRSVCQQAVADGAHVTLMGDSAGGNIALSLGFWWSAELTRPPLHQDGGSTVTPINGVSSSVDLPYVLKNVLAISPACDMRNSNPEILEADRHDPILSLPLQEQIIGAWTGEQGRPKLEHVSRSDPLVSPVCHNQEAFQRLKEAGIKVHGIYGTHDILAPDAELLRQKLVQSDIPGEWLVWKGQMHCFVLAGVYGLSEGKQGIDWCSNVLQRHV